MNATVSKRRWRSELAMIETDLPETVATIVDRRVVDIVRRSLNSRPLGDWELAFRSCYLQGFHDGQNAVVRRINAQQQEPDLGAGI